VDKDPVVHTARASWLQPGWRRVALLATTMLSTFAVPAFAQTLPTGGAYVAGSGSIGTAGPAMTIDQSTNRGIINWQGFSIGAANQVQINNGAGATLNRVTGGNLSTIAGQLGATGSVYLVNPNGVVVGPGGKVLTGGSFVASTRDVPNDQFMGGGTLTFAGTSNGTVTNAGAIASQNGDVVLIGQAASNSGTISAPNGTAALAAGNQVLLAAGNGPAGIYVAPDVTATGDATNTGAIKAAAAALASAGGNVYALAGNRGGLIQATGTKTIAGQVWLTAPNGTVEVSGAVAATNAGGTGGQIVADGETTALDATAQLSASGTTGGTVLVGIAPGGTNKAAATTIASGAQILTTGAGTAGGHIETSGQTLALGSATIDAGAGGSWVIDPLDLTINAAAATTIGNALNDNTNVTEETTGGRGSAAGDINVNADITWGTSAVLTLSAFHSVNVNAAITATGNGTLDIRTDNNIRGTSSGGSFNIAMGKGDIQFTTPSEGKLVINEASYTLIWTLPELQDVGTSGHYALADNVDASAFSGFAPIAGEERGRGFTGTFNGLGNTISALVISEGAEWAHVGLFGEIGRGGVVEDIGLVGGSVTADGFAALAGEIAGLNEGTISNAYATGTVHGGGYTDIGGLVGENRGTISGSSASGDVIGADFTSVGGLVGVNKGTIRNSSATGHVSGGFASDVGPLVGKNEGAINP
jgi:filamentous hemagglutinin family protein